MHCRSGDGQVLSSPYAMQVPAHEQLTYLNEGAINDVLTAPGIHVQGLPFSHDKSPQRWKNVRSPTLSPYTALPADLLPV